jgi:hypothetical protein
MHRFMGVSFFAFLLCAVCPSVFSQLRYNSEYSQDRINTDLASFMLHDSGAAEYQCASEWTTMTIQSYLNNTVVFLWHFRDGTKAFARQAEYVGDIGKLTGYLVSNKTPDLEDQQGKKIQPMTRNNPPVRVEVWIGDFADSKGYSTDMLIDKACFDAQAVEYNQLYHFEACK